MTWEELYKLAIEKGYQPTPEFFLFNRYFENNPEAVDTHPVYMLNKMQLRRLEELFHIMHWLHVKKPGKHWYEMQSVINEMGEELKQLP